MVTWFNAVASDRQAKCDNWHYYYQHLFCCFFMYRSDHNAANIWLFLTVFSCDLPKSYCSADWDQRSVTLFFYIFDHSNDISVYKIHSSYFCVFSQGLQSSSMSRFTLTALHAIKTKTWWDSILADIIIFFFLLYHKKNKAHTYIPSWNHYFYISCSHVTDGDWVQYIKGDIDGWQWQLADSDS